MPDAKVKRALDTVERREAASVLPERSFLRSANYWRARLKQLAQLGATRRAHDGDAGLKYRLSTAHRSRSLRPSWVSCCACCSVSRP
jgi:hypothetical protein